jgi:hypothetical protein
MGRVSILDTGQYDRFDVETEKVHSVTREITDYKIQFDVNHIPCYMFVLHTYLPMKMEKSAPKRRHIKFRRREITQNKAHNIQNTAKV